MVETPFIEDIREHIKTTPITELIEKVETVLQVALRAKDSLTECYVYKAMAQVYKYYQNSSEQRYYLQKQLDIAQRYQYAELESDAFKELSFASDTVAECIMYLERAVNCSISGLYLCALHCTIAHKYSNMELMSECLEHIEKAQKIFSSVPIESVDENEHTRISILIHLAQAKFHLKRKNKEKVEFHCDEVEKATKTIKDSLSQWFYQYYITTACYAKGTVYAIYGDEQRAIEMYKKLLDTVELTPPDDMFYRIHYNLACMLLEIREFDEALVYFDKVMESRQKFKDNESSWLECFVPMACGRIEYMRGNFVDAVQLYKKALKKADEFKYPELYFFSSLYKHWAIVLKEEGKYQEAYEMLEKYYESQQKIYDEKHNHSVAIMEAKQKVLIAHTRAERLREQKEALEVQRNIQEVEIRRYVDYKIYVEELLDSFAEIISKLQKAYREEKGQTSSSGSAKFALLVKEMKELQQALKIQTLNDFNESLPVEIEAKLQQALKEELTPLERKVALLIRAGLPTKQIASLIYKSESHLKYVRGNLRKKLILPENTNLKTFLCNL